MNAMNGRFQSAGTDFAGLVGVLFVAMSDIKTLRAGIATMTCHRPHNIFDLVPCDVVGSVILATSAASVQVPIPPTPHYILLFAHPGEPPEHAGTQPASKIPASIFKALSFDTNIEQCVLKCPLYHSTPSVETFI